MDINNSSIMPILTFISNMLKGLLLTVSHSPSVFNYSRIQTTTHITFPTRNFMHGIVFLRHSLIDINKVSPFVVWIAEYFIFIVSVQIYLWWGWTLNFRLVPLFYGTLSWLWFNSSVYVVHYKSFCRNENCTQNQSG